MPYETLKIVLRRIAIWFCTAFLCFIPLTAQQQATLPGTYAPGDASVAYSKAWFPFSTPAALAAQQQSGIQILYENRYITKTLANKSLNLWFVTPYFNIGGSFTHFGYSSYHEMMGALTLARQLGEHVRLGVEVDYFSVYLSEIGEYHGAVTAQVGLQVVPCRHLVLGFNLFNPTFSSVKTDELSTRLPVRFQLGFCYSIGGMVDWHVEVDKTLQMPWRWATGFEYSPYDLSNFVVRLGANGSRFIQPSMGVGFEIQGFGIDVDAQYHTRLGFSLMGALRYRFSYHKKSMK